MMKRYFFLPVTILSMIVLSMIALTGCVAVSPPPPARLTGHVELQDFRYEQQTLVLTVSSAKKPVKHLLYSNAPESPFYLIILILNCRISHQKTSR